MAVQPAAGAVAALAFLAGLLRIDATYPLFLAFLPGFAICSFLSDDLSEILALTPIAALAFMDVTVYGLAVFEAYRPSAAKVAASAANGAAVVMLVARRGAISWKTAAPGRVPISTVFCAAALVSVLAIHFFLRHGLSVHRI